MDTEDCFDDDNQFIHNNMQRTVIYINQIRMDKFINFIRIILQIVLRFYLFFFERDRERETERESMNKGRAEKEGDTD